MTLKVYYIALVILVASILRVEAQTYALSDTNFRNCLAENYPESIDINGELVISEAETIVSLNCQGDSIVDIDGLQFLTNLEEINISENQISSLSEIVNLTHLRILDVSINQLETIPSLLNFSELESLDLEDNAFEISPELPQPSNLLYLNLSRNSLSEYPNLEGQTQLVYFNSSRNTDIQNKGTLFPIDSLREFHCYLCGLKNLPDFSIYPNLEVLNIGYNELVNLPTFSSNPKLKTIYTNHNNLVALAGFNELPDLEKVRLYNNYLSFEDFRPLLSDTGYAEIFKIVPQNAFGNPLQTQYFEGDSIYLRTNVALTEQNAQFTWYKDGEALWSGTQDTFYIPSISSDQAGNYNYLITSPDFPDLTLESDTVSVAVEACINADGFEITTTEATCEKGATLTVRETNQTADDLVYTLESTFTNKKYSSETGTFANLHHPEYKLSVVANGSCDHLIDDSIQLEIIECEEAYFTPNGDGVDDSFYFDREGTAKIYNKWGQLLITLDLPNDWDGSLPGSSKIAPGYYTVNINNGAEIFRISVIY